MTCTSRGLVTVFGRSRLKTIQWLVCCSSNIMILWFCCFQGFFKFFFIFFLRKIPNIYVSMEQKNGHRVTSLGELNATEIQQNIIEIFGARVYFG